MPAPADLEREHTLLSAAARHDVLRRRELESNDETAGASDGRAALELLALSEVLARKAGYGRQLTIRAARTAGASWSDIGQALGVSRQSAWESHQRWIEEQVTQHAHLDYEGMDAGEACSARAIAGTSSER